MTGHTRLRGDGGAVLVEFALMAPLFVLIAMGIAEFGLAYRDKLTLESSTRAAARTEANTNAGAGNNAYVAGPPTLPGADQLGLQALLSSAKSLKLDHVDRVIIFNATTSSGKPNPSCLSVAIPSGGYTGVSGLCNVYSGDFLASFPSTWSSSYEASWPPSSREVKQDSGPTFVGIYIKYRHETVTRFWGNKMTITARTVMRLDPCVENCSS